MGVYDTSLLLLLGIDEDPVKHSRIAALFQGVTVLFWDRENKIHFLARIRLSWFRSWKLLSSVSFAQYQKLFFSHQNCTNVHHSGKIYILIELSIPSTFFPFFYSYFEIQTLEGGRGAGCWDSYLRACSSPSFYVSQVPRFTYSLGTACNSKALAFKIPISSLLSLCHLFPLIWYGEGQKKYKKIWEVKPYLNMNCYILCLWLVKTSRAFIQMSLKNNTLPTFKNKLRVNITSLIR